MATEDGIAASYMLRATLVGHSQDVRVVATSCFPEGAIVSGSRDRTTRIWTQSEDPSSVYSESQCLQGPTGFVSAVCCMPPSDQFPQGLVFVGSHDCNIYCFNLDGNAPLHKLLGHSGAVCSLATGQFGTLVSGSWDKTARVWSGQKCMLTLEGHQGAVWAVALMPQQGLILTGSADRAIRLWRAGACEKTFTGHEDCVRGLAVLSTKEFLSCSNDGTIRHWETAGDCLHVYKGHTSFIYSIVALEDSDFFISCGEDGTVRVWTVRGDCQQTLRMPCPTVWSVTLLQNGDIVAGCSDNVARVFTRYEALKASPSEIRAFEEEVAKCTPAPQQLGDIKTEDLPGTEMLKERGKREGQTILIRDGAQVSAYMWSMDQQSWNKIGDVVGTPDGTGSPGSGSKVMYEGKEYDFVFNVDTDDNSKPIKLPYNVNEDPWHVAQRFIHQHQLPQDYLSNVANFIITNTKGVTLGAEAPSQDFCDPFTGGNRYVPGSSRGISIDVAQNGNTSPGEVPPENIVRNDGDLDALKDLVECRVDTLEESHIRTLETLLQWPSEFIFPALDVLRCAIRSEAVNSLMCGGAGSSQLVARIASLIASPAPANRMLALRFFVNMFLREAGQRLANREWEKILKVSSEFGFNGNKNTQIALGSLYLNFVLLCNSEAEQETNTFRSQWLVRSMAEVISRLSDPEAQFRLLLALGTLLHGNRDLCSLASRLNLADTLSDLCTRGQESVKLVQCAQQCINYVFDNATP
ncbi:phospholipase A-2-activating protein-like isoform X2 [Varroa jacobsoni]|uniref:phospholipase A-2-activating protein-like isoform X2 n=1 Tax=Varroa jacobsoni TaxID=62625 RepID=UPI000BF637DD|nr:phospholipase A-2-activating protein-like isoform X2 [Varroa jacobsoni]